MLSHHLKLSKQQSTSNVPNKVIAPKVIHNYDSRILGSQGQINEVSGFIEDWHEDVEPADQEGRNFDEELLNCQKEYEELEALKQKRRLARL